MSPVRGAVARKSGCLSGRNTCGLQSARTTVSYDFLMVTLRIVNRDTHRTKVPAPLKATASKRSKTAATPVVRGTTTKKRAPKSPKPATNLELREDSIRRLSEASFALFVAKGYHATSLDEIARAAGLTKGSIYFYFNSKQRLLLGLLEDAREAVVSPLLDHVHKIEGSATDKIAGFFRFSSLNGIEQPQKLLCLIKTSIEFRDRDDAISKRIVEIYDEIYSALEAILEAGKKRGEIASTSTKELASMIVATNDGMMLEWHRRGANIDGRKLVRTVWTTFLHGIEPSN